MKALRNFANQPKALLLADQGVFSGTSFLLTLFMARIFSAEQFGLFSLWLIGIYFLLNIISALGIQQYQVLSPKLGDKPGYIHFNIVLLVALLLVSSVITFGLVLPFLPEFKEIESFKVLLVVFAFGFLLHDFFRRLSIANHSIKSALILDISYAFIVVIICGLQLALTFTFEHFVALLMLSYLPALVNAMIVLLKEPVVFKHWKEFLVQHWLHGKWLIVSAFIQWWSSNLFVLASGMYIGIEALGAFRLVQSLFGLLNVCLQAIENHAVPTAARLYNEFAVPKTINFLNKLSYKTMLLFGSLLAVLFLFATPLLVAAAGPQYQEYGFVVRGMVVLYAFIIIGYPIRIGIRILLMNKHHVIGYALSLLVSFFSFNFLLEQYQLLGAIIGLISSQVIVLGFWFFSLRSQKFYLWKSYI